MAVKIIDHGSKEYRQMIDLRYQMLRKPLGLSFTQDEMTAERDHILLGCFDDDKLEGCCMLVQKKKIPAIAANGRNFRSAGERHWSGTYAIC